MSDYAISTRSSPLFNHQLIASLIQPIAKNQSDCKAYRTKVNLKITEQRNDLNAEKELRFEISRSDDFEFLFAEVLNNDKYQELAKEHDLIVDFDAFPKTIIQKLLCKYIVNNADSHDKHNGLHSFADGKPTEISLILDADRTYCSFELYSKTAISKGRIFALKMPVVRGEQLTSHLLKICSNQCAKLNDLKHVEDEYDKLKIKHEKLDKECEELKKQNAKYSEDSERIEELEDELELVKEERQNLRILAEEKDEKIEEFKRDNEDMQKEIEDINDELEIVGQMLREEQEKSDKLQKEKENLRRELADIKRTNSDLLKDVEKSKHVVKKYLANKENEAGQQSLDLRKLKEIEIDLKEKNDMVSALTATNNSLRQELEEEKKKVSELEQNCDEYRQKTIQMGDKLQLYRLNRTGNTSYLSPLLATSSSANVPTVPNIQNGSFGKTPTTSPFSSNVANGYKAVFPTVSAMGSLNSPINAYNQSNQSCSTTPGVIKTFSTKTSCSAISKLEIVDYAEKYGTKAAVEKYNIKKIIISNWRNKKELMSRVNALSQRKPMQTGLEDSLYRWLLEESRLKRVVPYNTIKKKATDLAEERNMRDFCYSARWLFNFLKRKHLRLQDELENSNEKCWTSLKFDNTVKNTGSSFDAWCNI